MINQSFALVSPIEDQESASSLERIRPQQESLTHRVKSVKSVLVVFSGVAMVFDPPGLRKKVHLSYPSSSLFFKNTSGEAFGALCPDQVDLLIDLTGPSDRQSFLLPWALKKMARISVGRDVGFYRRWFYDRVFHSSLIHSKETGSIDWLFQEQEIQKQTLLLAGVVLTDVSDTPADLSKTIAHSLPPLQRL